MLYKVIHIRSGMKMLVGSLEECQILCSTLKQGDYLILAQ